MINNKVELVMNGECAGSQPWGTTQYCLVSYNDVQLYLLRYDDNASDSACRCLRGRVTSFSTATRKFCVAHIFVSISTQGLLLCVLADASPKMLQPVL